MHGYEGVISNYDNALINEKAIMNWKEWHSKIELAFNADKTLHTLWVPISILKTFLLYTLISIFSLFCTVKDKNNLFMDAMGGNRKIIELLSYDEWKDKSKAWAILEMTKMTRYIIVGKNPTITRIFKKNWKDGKITIGGRKVEIDEGMIVEVTGVPMGDRKFYKDRKLTKATIKLFLKAESDKTKLVKSGKT